MNILTVSTGVIVQQVNTLGRMGAGLAAQIRTKWPVVKDMYYKCYKDYELGKVQLVRVNRSVIVANLYAQETIGSTGLHTDYAALHKGFSYLSNLVTDIVPIYVPEGIGCGLGGGYWPVVQAIIKDTCPQSWIVSLDKFDPYHL